ncbi:DUF2391 family protein [Halopelagius longus]|uniref:DUF2391 family protein n=1 Tax=Halopelagius longus TaxID=1236180 RepID=A0A1H1GLI6_9EURY|nr:DUF2391 family protein [Halopelagius longus]RDI69667.1 DUF2391 family protein [Halopelagius longus]SDR14084.1 putative integral membrane protein TIGR02587 [Halopelagius longus]
MRETHASLLRDQGRGIAGALLVVGLSLLYTMETWWLAATLPMSYLLVYAVGGLAVVTVTTRHVNFRVQGRDPSERRWWGVVVDFSELLLQSFVTAYLVLLLFGILTLNDRLPVVVRHGLIQVVPLGFGASVSNLLVQEGETSGGEADFPKNVAVFTLGALFVAFPVAPTEEMEKIASHMGWAHALLLIVVSLLVSQLILHELGFRDQEGRVSTRSRVHQWGIAFVAYAVAATVSVALLAAFGHFIDTTLSEAVQQVVVLSFLASVGASAGEVVI